MRYSLDDFHRQVRSHQYRRALKSHCTGRCGVDIPGIAVATHRQCRAPPHKRDTPPGYLHDQRPSGMPMHVICSDNLAHRRSLRRRTRHTSPSTTRSSTSGSRTPVSRTCSSSSRCSILTSAPRSRPTPRSPASTPSHSASRIGQISMQPQEAPHRLCYMNGAPRFANFRALHLSLGK